MLLSNALARRWIVIRQNVSVVLIPASLNSTVLVGDRLRKLEALSRPVFSGYGRKLWELVPGHVWPSKQTKRPLAYGLEPVRALN